MREPLPGEAAQQAIQLRHQVSVATQTVGAVLLHGANTHMGSAIT
jgi:hypothetical protein